MTRPTDRLLERDAQLARLREALGSALAGSGGIVVVEGAAGVGKSALLRALRAEAEAAGALVRPAVGGELEREYPFGIVRQLLEPVVRLADAGERDELLTGAAALAGPVLGLGDAAASTDDASFATLHGLYWLVAALTERRPTVLVVDDAHWADEPSLRFCDFLARRAGELPLLLVVALRPDEPGAATDLLDSMADHAEIVRPAVLSPTAVAELVAEGLGERVGADVVASAAEVTGGNPLLLRELIRTLAAWDGEATAEVVRAAVPSSVTRSVQRRLRRLSAAAQRTARELAVVGEADDETSLAALRMTELIEGDPPVFVHPLIRQAVVDTVSPSERHALHRQAAERLRDRPGAEERVVMHLLAGPPLGEGWVVPFLREAAARVTAEGAADLGVRRLERALEELGHDDPAIQLDLGLTRLALGDPAAFAHLRVAERDGDPSVAARALASQFNVGVVISDAEAAAAVSRGEELLRLLPADARRDRGELLGSLLNLLTLDPRFPELRARVVERIRTDPGPMTLGFLCQEFAGGDATREETLEVLRRAVAFDLAGGLQPALASWTVTSGLLVDAPAEVAALPLQIEAAGRHQSSRVVAAFADYMRAMWQNAAGATALAEVAIRAAHERFTEFGSDVLERSTRGELVYCLVLRGRLDEAEALAAEVVDDTFDGQRLVAGTWCVRRAELRLAQGRWAEAVADLRRVDEIARDIGWRRFAVGFNVALLARALIAAGEREAGRVLAEREAAESARRGVASYEAMALVALGHGLEGPAALEAFAAAAAAGGRSATPLARATGLLEHGAALRRAGRRVDARALLAQAREVAHGAELLALRDRATEELGLAGGRPRRIAVSGVEALTPSERRVAEHAAGGLTNREIAETLFVTRKTVEFTLGNVFSKLGIRSRNQLPDALGTSPVR